ncbi:MAG: helix-turn-helix domain-containing protein, partial [Candidatus Merdivicinus sp.]
NSVFYSTDTIYKSPIRNNTFTVIVEDSSAKINQEIYFFTFIIITVSLCLMSVLIIGVIKIGKSFYNPMNSLLYEIRKLSSSIGCDNTSALQNEFEIIKNIYQVLDKDTKKLHANWNEYTAFCYYFKEYLNGLLDATEFQKYAQQISLPIYDSYSQFILFHIPDFYPVNMVRNPIINAVNTYINGNIKRGICFDIQKNTFLIYITSQDEVELKNIHETLMKMLHDVFNLNFHIGVSNICQNVDELLNSYEEAEERLNTAVFFDIQNNDVFSDGTFYAETTDYLKKQRLELLQCISIKDEEKAEILVSQFKDFILEKRDIGFAYQEYEKIVSEMDNCYHFSENGIINPINQINKIRTLIQMEETLLSLIRQLIHQIAKDRETQNQYCQNAKEYINLHYTKDISVTDIAIALNISYPYLSRLFKDTTQHSLLDYLNSVRIEHAKDYLIHTNFSLSEIASLVGYNNAQSFQRFFKKFESITPGEYRKIYSQYASDN